MRVDLLRVVVASCQSGASLVALILCINNSGDFARLCAAVFFCGGSMAVANGIMLWKDATKCG